METKQSKSEFEQLRNKKEIKQITKDSGWDYTEANNLALVLLSQELEENGLINFTLEFRADECASWVQAEYINETIKHPIIVDYDFPYCYENIDAFIETLEEIENEIIEINQFIK